MTRKRSETWFLIHCKFAILTTDDAKTLVESHGRQLRLHIWSTAPPSQPWAIKIGFLLRTFIFSWLREHPVRGQLYSASRSRGSA